jgi:hypothetical protein
MPESYLEDLPNPTVRGPNIGCLMVNLRSKSDI